MLIYQHKWNILVARNNLWALPTQYPQHFPLPLGQPEKTQLAAFAQNLLNEEWDVAIERYNLLTNSSRTSDNAVRISEQHKFDRQMFECEHCGRIELRSNRVRAHNQHLSRIDICNNCADDFCHTADGYLMHHEYTFTHRDGENYTYEEEERQGIAAYHSHAERHRIRFHAPYSEDKLKSDNIRLGIEWEYNSNCRDEDAEHADSMSFAIAERDSSLDTYAGIEIVTGYSTLGTVCKWVDTLAKGIDIGNTCDAGLHVNISGLSNIAYAKLITFFSSDENEKLICRVAGRYDVTYANKQDDSLANWLRRTKRTFCTDKYSHVHIHNHGNNYAEIRVFDSSEDQNVIKARVQFAWLAARFCEQPGLDLSAKRMMAWFKDNVWMHQHVRDLIAMNVGFVAKKHKVKALA